MPFNFTVPQFIEIEDKLVGPLSFKQFIYILGGLGGSFVLWRLLPHFISIFLIIPVLALAVSLAFFKVNDRPFIIVFISALKFYFGDKIFIWKKVEKKPLARKEEKRVQTGVSPKMVTGSKLSDIAWSLDVNEKVR